MLRLGPSARGLGVGACVPVASVLVASVLAASVLVIAVSASPAHAFSKAIWSDPRLGTAAQLRLDRRLGVSVNEVALRWDAVAPTRPRRVANPSDPAYRWPRGLDQLVAGARRSHVQVMIQVMGAPAWANGGHADWAWAPRRPSDYAAFIAAAARHYRSVHLWMVWGEPMRAGNFRPLVGANPGVRLNGAQKAAPHLYARILDAAYGALKRVSRRERVIGGDTYTTGVIDPFQWVRNLRLPNGRPPRMDMYAHNPFSYSDPNFSASPSPFDEVQFSDLRRFARVLDQNLRRGLPLFLSEWTIPTAPDNEFNFYADPPTAARWVRDALRLCRHWKRIAALGWIHIYDDPPASMGGLLTVSGKPKATFTAFARG